MSQLVKRKSRLHSAVPADAAWRYAQAHVDADIENLPRDREAERLVARMTADGLSSEQKIERIKAYYSSRRGADPEPS